MFCMNMFSNSFEKLYVRLRTVTFNVESFHYQGLVSGHKNVNVNYCEKKS